MNWTIGSDIEVMVERTQLISVAPKKFGGTGLLPDTSNAFPLPHGGIFYDNVLAEFTVHPASDKAIFIRNVTENLAAVRKMFADKGLGIRIVSSDHYPKDELTGEVAQQFGCAPDYDVYEMQVNEPSVSARKTTLRSAGAHVHIGSLFFAGEDGNLDMDKMQDMVKLMDLFLGIPAVLLDNTPNARERRKLYGKAGAHRPKDYPGVEYRPLANFWIVSPKLIAWVYDQTELAFTHLQAGHKVTDFKYGKLEKQVEEEEIRSIINMGDVKKAEEYTILTCAPANVKV